MKAAAALFCFAAAIPSLQAEMVQVKATAGVTGFVEIFTPGDYFTTGGAARLFVSRRWSVEPEYLYLWSPRRRNYSIIWANVAFDLRDRDSNAIPYLFGGPGVVWATYPSGGGKVTGSVAAGSLGGGIRFRISDRVFVGPQLRVGFADVPFAELTGSVGIILKK